MSSFQGTDTLLQTDVLEALTSARNYREWLCSLALPHLGSHPLEVGSGLGDYAQAWLNQGLPRITLSEANPTLVARLEARFAGHDGADVVRFALGEQREGDFSSVVSFNVLEHVPDDTAALRSARRLVRPGGRVVSFVPAFPSAMSRFDRSIGHYRRYTTTSLIAAYGSAGLTVSTCHYVNAPGLLAWYLGMRLMRLTPRPGLALNLWDRIAIPAIRRLENGRRPPFGQSVFCVGTSS